MSMIPMEASTPLKVKQQSLTSITFDSQGWAEKSIDSISGYEPICASVSGYSGAQCSCGVNVKIGASSPSVLLNGDASKTINTLVIKVVYSPSSEVVTV